MTLDEIFATAALILACVSLPVSVFALLEARKQLAYEQQKMAEAEARQR